MPSLLVPSAIRPVSALLLCALLGGCVGAAEVVGPPDEAAAPAASARRDEPVAFAPADVLRSWDRARARAYAAGDVPALRGLYAAGSVAGRTDARLLRGYLRRGLVVTGMQVQVLAVEVLHEAPDRLRLRVTDRLVGAVAVSRHGGATRLPRDSVSTRVVDLVRVDGTGPWLVERVRESARRPAGR